jgi:hypothetical protein
VEEDYLIKTVETLQAVTDRRNAAHDKNAKRVCDSQAAADIAEAMTATTLCTCRIIREALKLCKNTLRSVILN